MGLVIEAIWAVVLVGVPIALFTLAIVWWGMRNGHFSDTKDSKTLGLELKALSKLKTEPENDTRDIVYKKWAKFGGGFYGIVAFFTYIVIEVTDIIGMIINFGGFWDFIRHLNFGLLISIFIEAITNFIVAMVWPVYWMKQIDTNQSWMFFLAAYGGYVLGLKLAQQLKQRRSDA